MKPHKEYFQYLPSTLPIIIGTLVLMGWSLDIALLKQGIASGVAMNPATAIGFILLGLVSFCWQFRNAGPLVSRILKLAILVSVIASTLKLSDIALGTSFDIDKLLFAAQLDKYLDHPNRMAPNTALCFFLLSWAMLFKQSKLESAPHISKALMLIPALLSLLAIIGYIFGAVGFYGVGSYIPMALNTSIAFLFLSIGLLIEPEFSISSFSDLNQNAVEFISKFTPEKRGLVFRLILPFVLMFLALLVRLVIAPLSAGLQYLTFFPSVAIATVIGGVGCGLTSVLIGLCFATFILTPPFWTISLENFTTSFWSNSVFVADGLIICFSIEGMHQFRRKYMKELNDAKETNLKLVAINKELDDFTYIASHDLKEPLRGIHNYASVIKEDHADKLGDEVTQYVNSIQRLAERMTTLTDTLLAYSRLGSSYLKKVSVDVDSIVDEVTKDISSLRSEEVKLQRVGQLGNATGDAIRIGEVFLNLIQNAIKYNDKPEKLIEVGRDDKSGTHPVFYVRDNGIGIQPHHKDSVFRIFKRLHEQNKYGGGTGAGLTIVKKIIERHGGRIWLESVPGEGTTFYFTLCGGQ